MSYEAGIGAIRLGFEPLGWVWRLKGGVLALRNWSLEATIGASSLGLQPQGGDWLVGASRP